MKRSEAELINEATQHLTRLSGYVERSDLSDDIVFDAVCMRLSAAIDALSRIEETRRIALFGDNWRAMWGLRNRIAHGYVTVDRASVEATVRTDVPELIATLVDTAHRRSTGHPT